VAGAVLVATLALPLMLAWAPRLARAEGAERVALEAAAVKSGE